jgi:hypothetical protein
MGAEFCGDQAANAKRKLQRALSSAQVRDEVR